MMSVDLPNTITMISYIIGLVGVAGGVYALFKYSNYKTTVQLQNDNIKALQDKVTILESQLRDANQSNIDAAKQLSNLEGKLESYKEIPLQEISSSLAKLADSNQKILTTLQKSALIAASDASDGGVLVRTERTTKS